MRVKAQTSLVEKLLLKIKLPILLNRWTESLDSYSPSIFDHLKHSHLHVCATTMTMKMLLRAIICCGVLRQALANGLSDGLPDEAAMARQEVGAGKIEKDTIDAIFDEDGSLSAMWEQEAKRAQLETRRLFFSNQGSMPLVPTSSPLPAQTASPSIARTLEPTSGTFPPASGETLAPSSEGTLAPSSTETLSPDSGGTLAPASEETLAPDSGGTLAPVSGGTPAPSSSQTSGDCLEGTTLDAYLTTILTSITPEDILLDTATPQGQALAAMISDPFVEQNACSETIDQRYGLITFYYSTGGEEWSTQTSWLTDSDECTWFGVICDDADSRATNLTLGAWLPSVCSFSWNPVLTSFHHITGVNNLAGPIPEEISTLFKLTRLELFGNNLTSTIPAGIANLTELAVIDVEENSLTGTPLSEAVMQLTSLSQAFFSRNAFEGTIPTTISNLASLQDFWIAANSMSGSLPVDIGGLTMLRSLIMYENAFDGPLPETFSFLTNITNMQLYDNDFSGNIPSSMFGLTQLSVLLLDGNFLDGSISSEISFLTALTDLRLHDNNFDGVIPDDIAFLSSLKFLTLGDTMLNGAIPNVFTLMEGLETIDLGNNMHTGIIPDSLFFLPLVSRVYLQGNDLTGVIPESWSNPPNMIDLFLNDNLLTGSIPTIDDGEFANLQELTLQYNSLTGAVPEPLCALRADDGLARLFTDCGGDEPEVDCLFPTCCNRCFEGENPEAASPEAGSNSTERLLMENKLDGRHAGTRSDRYSGRTRR
jgi:Leucine-rich repeat (LRR) protein